MISWLFGWKTAQAPDGTATPANSPRDQIPKVEKVEEIKDVEEEIKDVEEVVHIADEVKEEEPQNEPKEDVPDTTEDATPSPLPRRQPKFSHPLQEAADNKSIPDDVWYAMYEKYLVKERPSYPIAPGMHPLGLSAAHLPHAHGGNAYTADAFQDDMPVYIQRLREVHCSGYVPPAELAHFHLKPIWSLRVLLEAAELALDD